MTQPAAVAVHCAVGVRWPPYSSGIRYWRSAEQKCELVIAAVLPAKPPSITIADSPSPSAIVEQAPNNPMKGMPSARMP